MPSRKGLEQALTWLRSKMAGDDILDGLNAELCYNVILDLQKRRKAIGAMYHQTREKLNTAKEEIQQRISADSGRADCLEAVEELYERAVKAMREFGKDGDPPE